MHHLNVDQHSDQRRGGCGQSGDEPSNRLAKGREIGRRTRVRVDGAQHAEGSAVRGHRRTAVAQKRRHHAGERGDAHHAGRHHQDRNDQEERERVREKEAVIVRRRTADAKAAPGDDAVRKGYENQSHDAELLADGGQHEIRVARRQIPCVAEAEAGAKRPACREGPNRLSDLVSAGDGVVPGRLPHSDALGKRMRDVQPIPDIETSHHQHEPRRGEANPAPGHGVHREEYA